jgi:hypothetical protein
MTMIIILLLIILFLIAKGINIENFDNKKVYCFQNNKCVEKENNKPAICGMSTMTNDPNPIYNDLENCKKANLKCEGLSREQCMITSQCGWCTNQFGEGKCIYGDPTGPQNPIIQCYPEIVQDNINSYIKGDAVPFVKDKYEEKDFYKNIL